MPRFTLVVGLALLGGCDVDWLDVIGDVAEMLDDSNQEPLALDSDTVSHRYRLDGTADGMYLEPADQGGHAVLGLYGMTCRMDTSSGYMPLDIDIQDGEDQVEDGRPDDAGSGHVIVAAEDDHVTTVDTSTGEITDDVVVQGHVASRFTDDGFVSIVSKQDGSCEAEWHSDGVIDRVVVDEQGCPDRYDFEVDRETGTAWLASDSGLVEITRGGTVVLDIAADIIAFDPELGGFYTANQGDTTVSAYDLDGMPLWTTEVDGGVYGLDNANGDAIVSIETNLSYSAFVILDGASGEAEEQIDVRRPAGQLVVSDDGLGMALVQEGGSDFFELDPPADI